MNHKIRISIVLAACLLVSKPKPKNAALSAEDGSRSDTSLAERAKRDARRLRSTLIGKGMNEVVKIPGQPLQVLTWDYKNAALDPVTGRTVRSLEIVIVHRVDFAY